MQATAANTSHKSDISGFDLDALQTPAATANWLSMSEYALLENARRKKIPSVVINKRVIRFHPRTILAAKGRA
ncbi:MAG: hypothetical protein WCS42_13090 [Verrucomicrobiota bacterium]